MRSSIRIVAKNCPRCREDFSYENGKGRARTYCVPCARARKLEMIAAANREYRRLEKIRLEAARA